MFDNIPNNNSSINSNNNDAKLSSPPATNMNVPKEVSLKGLRVCRVNFEGFTVYKVSIDDAGEDRTKD